MDDKLFEIQSGGSEIYDIDKYEDQFSWNELSDDLSTKLFVTSWETFENCEMKIIVENFDYPKFLESIGKRFLDFTAFSLFFLPMGGMWEGDRVHIISSEQLINIMHATPATEVFNVFVCSQPNSEELELNRYTRSINQFLDVKEHDEKFVNRLEYNSGKYDEENQRIEKHKNVVRQRSSSILLSNHTSVRSGSISTVRNLQIPAVVPVDLFDEKVFLRDGDMCVFCSISEDLKAARIIDWDEAVTKDQLHTFQLSGIDDVRNALTLCSTCWEVFDSDLAGIHPDNNVLVSSVQLLKDPNRGQQWKVLHGQQARVPLTDDALALWPSHILLQHRYNHFVQQHERPGAMIRKAVTTIARKFIDTVSNLLPASTSPCKVVPEA